MTARSFRSRAALMVVSMLTPLLVIGVLGTAVTAAAAPLTPDTGFNPAAGIPQLIYVDRVERAQAVVGVPVAPAMWVTNYMLIYALSPEAAAKMPAYWEAIPPDVVRALGDSPNGQVPYADHIRRF